MLWTEFNYEHFKRRNTDGLQWTRKRYVGFNKRRNFLKIWIIWFRKKVSDPWTSLSPVRGQATILKMCSIYRGVYIWALFLSNTSQPASFGSTYELCFVLTTRRQQAAVGHSKSVWFWQRSGPLELCFILTACKQQVSSVHLKKELFWERVASKLQRTTWNLFGCDSVQPEIRSVPAGLLQSHTKNELV